MTNDTARPSKTCSIPLINTVPNFSHHKFSLKISRDQPMQILNHSHYIFGLFVKNLVGVQLDWTHRKMFLHTHTHMGKRVVIGRHLVWTVMLIFRGYFCDTTSYPF